MLCCKGSLKCKFQTYYCKILSWTSLQLSLNLTFPQFLILYSVHFIGHDPLFDKLSVSSSENSNRLLQVSQHVTPVFSTNFSADFYQSYLLSFLNCEIPHFLRQSSCILVRSKLFVLKKDINKLILIWINMTL